MATKTSTERTFPLASLAGLELHQVMADVVTHRGRRAVRLLDDYE